METCRTCAKCDFVENDEKWLDVLHPEEAKKPAMENVLTTLKAWKLKISPSDGLPHKICSDCFMKFCSVHELRLQTEQAQLKLTNIFLDKIDTSTDNIDDDEEADKTSSFYQLEQTFLSHTVGDENSAAHSRLFKILNNIEDNDNVAKNNANNDEQNTANAVTSPDSSKPVDSEVTQLLGNNKLNATNAANVEPTESRQFKVSGINLERGIKNTSLPALRVSIQPMGATAAPSIAFDQTLMDVTATSKFLIASSDAEQKSLLVNQSSAAISNETVCVLDSNAISKLLSQDAVGNAILQTNAALSGERDASKDNCEVFNFEDFIDNGSFARYGDADVSFASALSARVGRFHAQDLEESEQTISNDSNNNGNDSEIFGDEFSLTFECKYCYKPVEHFKTQTQLLRHITQHHNSELPFDCPKCEKSFSDAAGRTVHIKSEHVEKQFSCKVCGKRYADRAGLRHHVEKYHIEVDFECDLCKKRFYSRKSLNYHKKWHDPRLQQKCSYCDRLFINQRHLKCHEETHTGLRNCEYCSFCGKSFIHLKTLRWHIYRLHGGPKPYKCGCGSCTEVFSSYREKRMHMLDKHSENLTSLEKSECMLCHEHFDDEDELKRHMSEDHKPQKTSLVIANNKRVLQNKCKKSFSGIFQCGVCSQRFNMKSALERHSAVHSIEGRPYACPQCPKRFKRSQDMKWHLKTHSEEKQNICDICGKGFALKYVLTQHKRSHEILEKNFKCSTCGRAYLFEKTLRVHERVHSDKTYYKCDLCHESFVTHIKFKYHMNKKHSPDENGEIPLDDFINIVIP